MQWIAKHVFFVALATDYDGTLAKGGRVEPSVRNTIEELRRSGRKLILVTGRDLPDLKGAFGPLDVFDMVVAENGALLFDPVRKEEAALGEPPSPALVERLQQLGVKPLSVGRSIIATWEPNESVVLEAIRELGLEYNIIFNKGAVMVLPSGINKASGLKAALKRLRLSAQNVVGIGDAENDQAFLRACGCAVAVANALPAVRAKTDFTVADHGAGVIELAQMLVRDDLASVEPPVPRAQPIIGQTPDGLRHRLNRFDTILVTGSSGGGKSTIVTALLEQMRELGYQFCVLDPEGDYEELAEALVVGDAKHAPRLTQAAELLAKPEANVVVNLLAIGPIERPPFVGELLPSLTRLRVETGRPHWIVLDEAHYCLPARWDPAPLTLPQELAAVMAITVHPEEVAPDFLARVSIVVAVGQAAPQAIGRFCQVVGRKMPDMPNVGAGQALLLDRNGNIHVINPAQPSEEHKRHQRKYAEGKLGDDKSFYFRGPQSALNLRAYNLSSFLQLAAGVDEATWLHHLREGAYSRWFRDMIKDDELARHAADIEHDGALSAADSRARIKELIESRYTACAG